MGLLDQIPAKIYAGFKNKLHTGVIRQTVDEIDCSRCMARIHQIRVGAVQP